MLQARQQLIYNTQQTTKYAYKIQISLLNSSIKILESKATSQVFQSTQWLNNVK